MCDAGSNKYLPLNFLIFSIGSQLVMVAWFRKWSEEFQQVFGEYSMFEKNTFEILWVSAFSPPWRHHARVAEVENPNLPEAIRFYCHRANKRMQHGDRDFKWKRSINVYRVSQKSIYIYLYKQSFVRIWIPMNPQLRENVHLLTEFQYLIILYILILPIMRSR